MKSNTQAAPIVAPTSTRAVWEEFRNDHELLERLNVTPEEIKTLEHCSLLGTLSCKQDMLFILREIREATGPFSHDMLRAPNSTSDADDGIERPLEEFSAPPVRIAPGATRLPQPGSLATIVPRRTVEHSGILFWLAILAVGLLWNAMMAILKWRDNVRAGIGAAAPEAPAPADWFSGVDSVKLLIAGEILFVVSIVAFGLLRHRRGSRRLKVKPY